VLADHEHRAASWPDDVADLGAGRAGKPGLVPRLLVPRHDAADHCLCPRRRDGGKQHDELQVKNDGGEKRKRGNGEERRKKK
jgi:hypothetical protein